MIISLNWLKEFTFLPDDLNIKEFTEKFNLSVCEIEKVKDATAFLREIRIVEIREAEPHPRADKLNLVTVQTEPGSPEALIRLVCGAPNVRPGLKVAYAPVGTAFPQGFVLEAKKIKGIVSPGMLCSEQELELGPDADGLKEYPPEAPIGCSLQEYHKIPPAPRLDIDNKSITHRPDLWGHYGMAREVAAMREQALKNPYEKKWKEALLKKISRSPEASPLKVRAEKDSASRGYRGLSIDGVCVGESPEWMVKRLEECGLRSINNMVDISNYVMLETGFPLHIYDRDRIQGEIHIRRARPDEKLITLDETERVLNQEDTVVADREKALVVAGIMGGAESGVTEKTTRIFLETANWNPAAVRKTSAKIGLRSDSSQRYEKSLDSRMTETVLLRAFELITELSSEARPVGQIESAALPPEETTVITTTVSRINRILGTSLKAERIEAILASLEFKTDRLSDDELKVTVPSFRATKDIEAEEDIIEEIGRLTGYDNIREQAPHYPLEVYRLPPERIIQRKIQDFLSLHGHAQEIMTYPLIGKKLLEKCLWPAPEDNRSLQLLNPLSPERDRMRPGLIPGLLEAVSQNQRKRESFRLFELGRSYRALGGMAAPVLASSPAGSSRISGTEQAASETPFSEEYSRLGIAFYGTEKNSFTELVNTTERLLAYLNLSVSWNKVSSPAPGSGPARTDSPFSRLLPSGWGGYHPYEILEIQGRETSLQGVLFTVHPLLAKQFKLKQTLAFAILDISGLPLKDSAVRYTEISRFPHASFDCTVQVPQETEAQTLLDLLDALPAPEILSSQVADVYTLNESTKTLTLRSTFGLEDRTLHPEEISALEQRIVKQLEDAGYPLKQ